ncbi:sensor histidine kinase [Pseudobacillus sp. FSL P4-0506]|uniref:sensor histidine kinase n=1 Tax=Pseudobacillus sp. FSL P4-0506 TaxID=2921576 RepID=UPI0030F6D002
MRLFFREHLLLISFQLVQFFVFFLIFWLDGYHHISVFLYAVFIGLFLLASYLFYHYISRRSFYKRLENGLSSPDESLEKTGSAPTAAALHALLKSQYQLYMTALQRAEKRQEEHLEFIDRWVHQIKTPLSVIELTAQNLDEPESSNIREETERMRHSLNTVLYNARLRTIEQDFQIKPVLLAKTVQAVNTENKRFYIRNRVYPRFKEQHPGITVESDEKWLFFILDQLVQNAVKYSAGRSSSIDITIYERDGSAILEVKDWGIGIPPEDRRRIFHKFFTGSNGRKYRESTGMGLYLVNEVCHYLGHQLEVETEVNEGSIFRIVFSPSQNLTSM